MVLRLCALVFIGLTPQAFAAGKSIAEELIPFHELSPTNQATVRAVTDHYTLRREYVAQRFTGRQAHFDFLMQHMVACSLLAQQLGYIRYHAEEDDAGRVWADNREGSRGFMQKMHVAGGKYVYYVAGSEKGAFEARGRGVVVVDCQPVTPDAMEYNAMLFIKVDNTVLAMLAQLFQVFIRGSVDKNFSHVMRHPTLISELAVKEPQRLHEALEQMPAEQRPLLREFEQLLK